MRFDLLGLTVACDRPLPGAVAPPSSILDVRVEEAIGSPARPARWVGENDWPRIALDSRAATLWFDDDAVFVLDPDARAIRYHLLCGLDDATFGHELVDHVLPRYVSMLGRHVIHGSAVAGRAGAVVFVGRDHARDFVRSVIGSIVDPSAG